MRVRGLRLVAALASLGAACSAAPGQDASADQDLIGGRLATLEDLPSTLHMENGCTAAKIGTRLLLTAAHCVLDASTLEPKYDAARPVKLARDPALGHTALLVAKVHVHPDWLRACEESLCAISAVTARLDAPDVAIVELAEDLRDVPVAPIDPRPLAPGDEVVVVGYGCTEGVHAGDLRGVASLAFADGTVVPPSRAVHDGSPVTEEDLPVYSGNYAITAGPGASKARAGLCPGDSGGPLYARGEYGRLFVVGVNANYTLAPEPEDAVGLPVTNWHTRLDHAARHGVYAWISRVREAVMASEIASRATP